METSLSILEKRVNHVIGLKHALELVEPLRTTLEAAESDFFEEARMALEDERFESVLTRVLEILNENAKVQKGSASMRLQRCFAIKSGVNGLLDVARRIYCEIVDDVEDMVAALAEEHGLPLRVGFSALRGYHVQMVGSKRTPLLKAKDLPKNFLNPQEGKSIISFTTDEIIQVG
jgi:DNA mismatch repair protein MSH4